ncbi:MAG: hypothetical protein WC197_06700 [Candidatus Gastranaerophilaceae bacterium]|jgi:hypothetical protein
MTTVSNLSSISSSNSLLVSNLYGGSKNSSVTSITLDDVINQIMDSYNTSSTSTTKSTTSVASTKSTDAKADPDYINKIYGHKSTTPTTPAKSTDSTSSTTDTSAKDSTTTGKSITNNIDIADISTKALKAYQYEVNAGTYSFSQASTLYSSLVGNNSHVSSIGGLSSNTILAAYQAQSFLSI